MILADACACEICLVELARHCVYNMHDKSCVCNTCMKLADECAICLEVLGAASDVTTTGAHWGLGFRVV
jgi:hypothetical protein